MLIYLMIAVILFAFMPAIAYGLEISATPTKDIFGPNEWIAINLKIDGYQGGEVSWTATKPDKSVESGTLANFQASKKIHSIPRTAFDSQFGQWTIDYSYQGISKTITVNVESINLEVTTDKPSYYSGDRGYIKITTNYYEPMSTKAEDYYIEILDKDGSRINQFNKIRVKAYQPVIIHEIIADELLDYNPLGSYTVQVTYYNIQSTTQFEFAPRDTKSSIFISTEKKIYKTGEFVQLQLILSSLINQNAQIKVTDPSGLVYTKNVPITTNLSRIVLDDIPINSGGTYQLEVEYSGQKKNTSFVVESDDSSLGNKSGFTMSLNKQNFRPGETLLAEIKSSKAVQGQLNYWLEGPENKKTSVFPILLEHQSLTIPYSIPKDIEQGAWKFVIQFDDAMISSLFVVAGTQIDDYSQILHETYSGPKILMSIDDVVGNFNNPSSIVIDSGSIFILDSGNAQIKKFDTAGRLLLTWGSFGSGEDQLKNPKSLFADNDYIYVADTGNSRIQTYDKDGKFIRSWGNSGIENQSVKNPVSLTKDNDGTFFIADKSLPHIKKFDKNGNYAGQIEYVDTAAAKFSSSDSIVSDGKENLYILVSEDNRIIHYKTDGSFVKSFGTTGGGDGKLNNPTSITVDSEGNLYVTDTGNSRIQVFDDNGKFVKKWGTKGVGNGEFTQVSGIALDFDNNIYAIDSKNKVAQKFEAIVSSNRIIIPEWVRNNASWWNEGKLPDSEFASGIKYMINKKIIDIPNLEKSTESSGEEIPDWVRNNAKWWSEGKLTDKDFANGIEFLVKKGIIQV